MTTRHVPPAERSLRAAAWRLTTAGKALREAQALLTQADFLPHHARALQQITDAITSTTDTAAVVNGAVVSARDARRGVPTKPAVRGHRDATALARDPRDDHDHLSATQETPANPQVGEGLSR